MNLLKYELIFDILDDFLIDECNFFLLEHFGISIETVYTSKGEKFFVYLKEDERDILLDKLKSFFKKYKIRCNLKLLESLDDSYLYKWKEDYKPVIIDNIIISPSWIKIDGNNKIVIKIDPQTAFGTGHHESTKLAIKAINYILTKEVEKSFLDIGTGSGILSIVANKKGVKEILAIDNDFDAVKVAKENFIKNNVSKFTLICGNHLCLKKNNKFDIVVANIISSVLLKLKDFIKHSVKQDGYIILSGILSDEVDSFKNAFKFKGFSIVKEIVLNEWISIIAKRV